VNDVKIIEVRRGRDGKDYPAEMRRPRAELARLRVRVHELVCRDGLSIRQAQKTMLAEGDRRSLGRLHADLVQFDCSGRSGGPYVSERYQPSANAG
jgi:hypothetical protein